VKDNYLFYLSDQNITPYLKNNLVFFVDNITFGKFIIKENETIYSYNNFINKYIFYGSKSETFENNINRYKEFFQFLNGKQIKTSEIVSCTYRKNRSNYPYYQYQQYKFSFWICTDDIILLPQNILIGYFIKYKYTFDLQLIVYYLLRTNIDSLIIDDTIKYNFLYWSNIFDQNLMGTKIINYNDTEYQKKLYQTYISNYNNMYNITKSLCLNSTIDMITNHDICICLHIGNIYLAYDMYKYISKFKYEFDLYITICKEWEESYLFEQFMEKITMICKNIHILNVENYGADIYPFLYTLKYFATNNIKYKYLLKLHTKTDNTWRHEMIEPLVNTQIDELMKKIELNGIYGYTYFEYDYLNHNYLLMLLTKLGFYIFDNQPIYFNQLDKSKNIVEQKMIQTRIHDNSNYKLKKIFDFVPGTIFWTKYDLIMYEPAIYDLCEDAKVIFKKDYLFEQIPHAIERLFGIYRYNYLYTKI
jgi:hypothetical protein